MSKEDEPREPGPASGPEMGPQGREDPWLRRRGTALDAPERFLADASLTGEWRDRLTSWLSDRAELLPLLGFDAPFVRTISRMDPPSRLEYLESFEAELLDEQGLHEWEPIEGELKTVLTRMIEFWVLRRSP